MKLVNQEEARKIADKCEFKHCWDLCFYLGQDDPLKCCGLCADYGTTKCKGIVCPEFKIEASPCINCRLRDGECSRSQVEVK